MITLTSAQQAIVKDDATIKTFNVHFPNGERADLTNTDIVFESVRFSESVCSDQSFKFGAADASCIEFETVGVGNIIGLTIECSMVFTLGADSVTIPYGTFIVDSCPRNHESMVHRKITAYSVIKNMLESQGVGAENLFISPSVCVGVNELIAYYTGDVSAYEASSDYSMDSETLCRLYDSSGYAYVFYPYITQGGESSLGAFKFTVSFENYVGYNYVGYMCEYEETGSTANEDVGQAVADYLDAQGLDLTYNISHKKIYSDNYEALKASAMYLFFPCVYERNLSASSYIQSYFPYPCKTGQFVPLLRGGNNAGYDYGRSISVYALGNVTDVIVAKSDSTTASTVSFSNIGTVPISGYSATFSATRYKGVINKLTLLKLNNTIEVENGKLRFTREAGKLESNKGYGYINAYSTREMLSDWAEFNASFLRQERDGTTSFKKLNNSSPYALTASDVEGHAWWDEYTVKSIGKIRYSFTSSETNGIMYGTYTFDETKPSVYDLSGNKILESMDFTIHGISSYQSMSDRTKYYLYEGSENGYVNGDFYYYDGSSWVDGGMYFDATTIIEYVLDMFFVPYISNLQFTPLDANFRGIPFLQCGDAITLTASDGTVINSYILDHAFSGIQHITEDVETVQGQILDSEVVY